MNVEVPDFDVLVALHQYDPQALEEFRRHMLQQAVASAPAVHRPSLEQLLLRIEAARSNARDPLEAAHVAFRMMGDSVHALHDAWGQALETVAGLQAALLIERVSHPDTLRTSAQRN